MINKKVLDWIEGYVLSRMLIFGDFVGTVKRSDLIFDLDTTSEYFRKHEGQRIQSLSLPVKSRNLSTLLGEIEACFRQGWILMDNGEWTESDFDQVYGLSRQISDEIMVLREQFNQENPEPYYPLADPTRHK
jgi:hypothetical protein